jgi:hypothetical protein
VLTISCSNMDSQDLLNNPNINDPAQADAYNAYRYAPLYAPSAALLGSLRPLCAPLDQQPSSRLKMGRIAPSACSHRVPSCHPRLETTSQHTRIECERRHGSTHLYERRRRRIPLHTATTRGRAVPTAPVPPARRAPLPAACRLNTKPIDVPV